jgi:hypothetical protein
VSNSGTFDVEKNTLTGQQGAGINIAHFGGGTWTGHVLSNHVGSATLHSGSTAGNGINLVTEGTGTLTAEVGRNTVQNVDNGFGIAGSSDSGSATLNLTLGGNSVNMGPSATEFDGITVNSGTNPGDTSSVCLNTFQQAIPPEGFNYSIAMGVGSGAFGMSATGGVPGTHFALQGYTGAATDMTAVQNFLIANNTLLGNTAGGGGPASASNPNGFTSGTCTPAPARDLPSASARRGAHRTAGHRAAKHRATIRSTAKHHTTHRAASHGATTRHHVSTPAALRSRLRIMIHKLLAAATGGGQSPNERR